MVAAATEYLAFQHIFVLLFRNRKLAYLRFGFFKKLLADYGSVVVGDFNPFAFIVAYHLIAPDFGRMFLTHNIHSRISLVL